MDSHMPAERFATTEQLQRQIAHLVATAPAGAGLCLIGGFRYRLLDRGVRRSVDIDYHWDGDLAAKQRELIDLFERRLLPDVRRRLGLEGAVSAARGAASESTAVAIVELAFWRLGSELGRIEIPVEITRIERVDPPTARTSDGVVYRTPPRPSSTPGAGGRCSRACATSWPSCSPPRRADDEGT